jgi:two-component system, NtrC family, nitrogen regulation response regulator GlnG
VIRIHLPPLRARREDIALLARYFLKQSAEELGVEVRHLLPETSDYLARLPWPGNVRQLENTCRWITVMAPSQAVRLDDLPPELHEGTAATTDEESWRAGLKRLIEQRLAHGESNILEKLNPEFERILLQAALAHTGGRKQEAALKLGWGRNTLTRKLKELGLEDDSRDGGGRAAAEE